MPVPVHVAENPAIAEILKDLLIGKGIQATVTRRGWRSDPVPRESRTTSRGKLVSEVWIADEKDLERARTIRDFESGPRQLTGWNWRCPKCGEEVEAQFTECWQCGTSRTP